MSTRRGTQSDKAFGVRDIQFDDPKIRILILAPLQVIAEIMRILSVLLLGAVPLPTPVQLRHPLKDSRISAILRGDYQDSPGFGFPLAEDNREAAFGVHAANQGSHFEVGGEARLQG